MSDDESKRPTSPQPERGDMELIGEVSIRSLGFPDTDRPPTDPFGSADSAVGTDSSGADSTEASGSG